MSEITQSFTDHERIPLKDYAEKAYLDSHGSFDEVIVSLLTSDSFIYRKSSNRE